MPVQGVSQMKQISNSVTNQSQRKETEPGTGSAQAGRVCPGKNRPLHAQPLYLLGDTSLWSEPIVFYKMNIGYCVAKTITILCEDISYA